MTSWFSSLVVGHFEFAIFQVNVVFVDLKLKFTTHGRYYKVTSKKICSHTLLYLCLCTTVEPRCAI